MNTIINFLYSSIRVGTPLLFGTTGEIISERSGSLNLGVEGMMAMGAIGGFCIGCLTDSFAIALIAAFVTAALGALIYAILTVTLQANQNVTGLALTIFGVGFYQFIGRTLTALDKFPKLGDSPRLQNAVADKGIPLLRDIPYIGKLLFSFNYFVYIGVVIAIICWIYIVKTKKGLRMRSIGENPSAADACGINVNATKYFNIILSGGICGLGGLYLALVINGGAWNENWINGMGWISVALVIFANWNPIGAIFGGFLFGMFNALMAWKGNLASAFPKLLSWLGRIPNEFYQMLPFFITALILVVASMSKKKKSAQPASLGLNYFREER